MEVTDIIDLFTNTGLDVVIIVMLYNLLTKDNTKIKESIDHLTEVLIEIKGYINHDERGDAEDDGI